MTERQISRENTRLTLPWEVLVTDNRRKLKRGVLTKEYRAAKENAAMVVMGQVRGERPRYPEGSLQCVMEFYPPDNRRRDVSNYVKLLLDCMKGIVYADDYQVSEMFIRRNPPADYACVNVAVGSWAGSLVRYIA